MVGFLALKEINDRSLHEAVAFFLKNGDVKFEKYLKSGSGRAFTKKHFSV